MKVLEIVKNCDNCIKKDACKFLEDYLALVKSNKFYSMFEYLEWNNLDRIFKANAPHYKCYHPAFPDGKVEIGKHPSDIIMRAFDKYKKDHALDISSWYSEPTKEGNIKYTESNTRKDIEIPVSHLDYEIKIVSKLTSVL